MPSYEQSDDDPSILGPAQILGLWRGMPEQEGAHAHAWFS